MTESTRKVTSFRLTELATRQLAALVAATGMNQSETISTALDRMYQQEIKTMASTYSLAQLDSTVNHLNEILKENGYDSGYELEPITGTDNFTLYLHDEHIATAPSQTMYTIVYALKHVHRLVH